MAFPITPAQAAILGRTRPPPVATVNAAASGQSAPAPTGQTPVVAAPPPGGFSPNNMGDLLLQRANRPGDIRTGTGLLGRLAAMGVGSKINRDNESGQREETIAQLVAMGMSPEQASLVAKGVIRPPEPAQPTDRKTFKDATGRSRFQDTGELLPGESKEGEPLDVKSAERLQQDVEIAEAKSTNITTKVTNLTGPAGAVASAKQALDGGIIDQKTFDKIEKNLTDTAEDKAGISDAKKAEVIRVQMEPIMAAAVKNIREAADALAANPLDQEAKAQYDVGQKNFATAKSKLQLPFEAVTNDQIKAVTDSFPSAAEIAAAAQFGQNPVNAIFDAEGLGQNAGPAQPSKPFEEMNEVELDEYNAQFNR